MKHIKTYESFLNEGTNYAVKLTGGSIGDKSRPRDAKGYVGMEVDKDEWVTSLSDAHAKVKRMNANLSPGEKSHYGLKYVVVPVKDGKFIKESVNEGDMTKDYDGFIVSDTKNTQSWKFKYVKGTKNNKVEDEAIAKVMKDTGKSRADFWVTGFIKKGDWNNDKSLVLESFHVLDEGAISNLYILVDQAKNLEDFIKAALKEYDTLKDDRATREFLTAIYNEDKKS